VVVFGLSFFLGKNQWIDEASCLLLAIVINQRLILEMLFERRAIPRYQRESNDKLKLMNSEQRKRALEKDENVNVLFRREQNMFCLRMAAIAVASVASYFVFLWLTDSLSQFLTACRPYLLKMLFLDLISLIGDIFFIKTSAVLRRQSPQETKDKTV